MHFFRIKAGKIFLASFHAIMRSKYMETSFNMLNIRFSRTQTHVFNENWWFDLVIIIIYKQSRRTPNTWMYVFLVCTMTCDMYSKYNILIESLVATEKFSQLVKKKFPQKIIKTEQRNVEFPVFFLLFVAKSQKIYRKLADVHYFY